MTTEMARGAGDASVGALETIGFHALGRSSLGGHGDGMHINLRGRYAYIGHAARHGMGISIVDVSDPRTPAVVRQIEAPLATRTAKVQVVDDLLLVSHERKFWEEGASEWRAGLQIMSLEDPENPREIAFFPTKGVGVHRITCWEAPYVYMSASDDGFTDQFMMVVDISEPTRPEEVGRWWLPGMWKAGGEEPSWSPNRRAACHHALVFGDRAYCGWWDSGFVILDVSDKSAPKLISHLSLPPEESSYTHTALLLPDKDVVLLSDEALHDFCDETPKQIRVVDISDERVPTVAAKLPVPEGDYCTRGGRFGPHNLHEPRPGSWNDPDLVFATYFNAGVRAFDVSDPTNAREVGSFVPVAPEGQVATQLNDLIVDPEGVLYVTDRQNGGLYILQWDG